MKKGKNYFFIYLMKKLCKYEFFKYLVFFKYFYAQVIWLQPSFFSVLDLQLGQFYTKLF
jgi:hypothetical protein